MLIDEYLKTVTEQIRCKQARESVREEMAGHLEDQMQECMKEGMNRQEAEEFAVKQMGDPLEIGISLDRVHRPKSAWGMLMFIAILSVLGMGVQYFISIQCQNAQPFILRSQMLSMLVGFAVLVFMYCLDYSFFGSYGKYMAIVFLSFMFLQVFFLGQVVNGAKAFISVWGGRNISLQMLMFCFIPMYAGVLYSYRGEDFKGMIKSMIFLVLPVWITMHMPCLGVAIVIFFTLFIMLSAAIIKGWFGERTKKLLIVAWGIVVLFPPLMILAGAGLGIFSEYQLERLQFFVHKGDHVGNGYVYYQIRKIIENSKILGRGDISLDTSTVLPQVSSDFIITHLMSYYGILSGLFVFGLLSFLVFKIFHISAHQKNQLGTIIGIGCGSLFGVTTILYFLENIGVLPYSYLYLPFFSLGGTGMFATYFLLGIILSIYKYQDIPLKVKDKKLKITI